MSIFLRDYQVQGKHEIRVSMRQFRRVLYVLSTGGGKTILFASVAHDVSARGLRVYLIAHRIEIVLQIAATLRREGVRFGIVAPGYSESTWPVQVCMIQTLSNRMSRMPRPDMLVVDEAHHAVSPTYMRILQTWAGIFVLGVTATPARLDGRGLSEAFDTIVLGPTMKELQERGYLCRYTYFAPPVVAQLQTLKVRAGDYAASEVAAAMDQRGVIGDAEAHYRRLLNGKPAIAFCASVAHAEHVAETFRGAGWKAASVDGAMDATLRADRVKSIGDGRLNVLASCDIISEGTDIPNVQGAILLRPTLSLVTYLQQVGRPLRPKPDGSACVILDHVGNVMKHGLPNAPRDWDLKGSPKRAQAASVRVCPKCYATYAPAPACPECNHVAVVTAARRDPHKKVVAGTLTEVKSDNYLATAPLKELIRAAHTFEQLKKIGEARNYSPGWAGVQWGFKQDGYRRSGWRRHA